MTLRADGKYHCDRCGAEVGHGGLDVAARVSDIVTDPDGSTTAVVWDLCRASRKGAPRGCAGHVLSTSALADYLKQKATT